MSEKHEHDWVLHARELQEGTSVAVEVCSCGERRERKMSDKEEAAYAQWRGEVADLARTGPAEVRDDG